MWTLNQKLHHCYPVSLRLCINLENFTTILETYLKFGVRPHNPCISNLAKVNFYKNIIYWNQ